MIILKKFKGGHCTCCVLLYVVDEEFTLSSSQMSLSGSVFRPSWLSVQPVSQGGMVDGTAHTDMSAASPSVSGFSSALNAKKCKNEKMIYKNYIKVVKLMTSTKP